MWWGAGRKNGDLIFVENEENLKNKQRHDVNIYMLFINEWSFWYEKKK